MRCVSIALVAVIAISCACKKPSVNPPTSQAPGTPGATAPLPHGTSGPIFAKPVSEMNKEEVRAEKLAINDLKVKLEQRMEQLNEQERRLVEATWALWLRVISAGLFALAVVIVLAAVKMGWALPTFVKIALGLVVASSVCLSASFLVHYFLAIALCVVGGASLFLVIMLWHNGWNARKTAESLKERLAEAEDGVKVLAKTAGANVDDAVEALADADVHNRASLKKLIEGLGVKVK